MTSRQVLIDRTFKSLAILLVAASVALNALQVAPTRANEFMFGIGVLVVSLLALSNES